MGTVQRHNPFLRFSPEEFEFGEDLPWLNTRSDRAKWDLRGTRYLWGSAWKMLLPLMRRPGINEIIVRGPNRILVESREGMFLTSLNFDPNMPAPPGWPESERRPTFEDLLGGLERVHTATENKPFWTTKNAMGDARTEGSLEDGSRLSGGGPPIVVGGTVSFNIRRFNPVPFTFEDYIEFGTLTREVVDVLRMAIEMNCSFVIGSGAGTGKTSMLQTILTLVPFEKVILTVEDTPELKVDHWLASGLLTRSRAAGADDEFQVSTMSDLINLAKRLRSDWIICGDIRDNPDPNNSPAEAFMSAIQSGLAGGCTMNADDSYQAFLQLQKMLSTARPSAKENSLRLSISQCVRLVVIMERVDESYLAENGDRCLRTRRRISEIVECLGSDGEEYFLNPLFKTKIKTKFYKYGGEEIAFPERYLEMVGIPFFGLELEDRCGKLPHWWEGAKFEHASKIQKVGRAAHNSELLSIAKATAAPRASNFE